MKKRCKRKTFVTFAVGMVLAVITLAGINTATSFAKYITNASMDSQSVTVAKWGVIASFTDNNLFGTDYSLENGETLATPTESGTGIVIQSDNQVAAPGSKGGTLVLTVSGKPEVQTKVTLTPANDCRWVYLQHAETMQTYNPIVWTLTKISPYGNYVQNFNSSMTLLNSLKFNFNGTYPAGTNLSERLGTYEISWYWNFTGITSPIDGYTIDELDTILGNNEQSSEFWMNTTMSIGVTLTVEQVI